MILVDDEVLFPQWISENEILCCKTGNFLAQLKVVKLRIVWLILLPGKL